jgi:UDP:flavonoid glycosyltransferase YjiC (YdhE family)
MLVTSFPGRGHLNPVLPLALAARAAGHEVRVATGADQLAHVTSYGLEAVEIGPGLDDLIAATREEYGEDWGDAIFPEAWPRTALPRLLSFAQAWAPELVVSEEEEYAGPLLADLLGVPSVTHSWPSPCRPAADREEALERLAQVWSDLAPGHSPRGVAETYLDACPPLLQSPEIQEFGGVIPIRAVSLPEPADADPPPWLADLPRPAAYVTLGTVPVFSTPDRLRACIDAVAPLVAALVVTTGPNDVEALGQLPDHVHAVRYATQSELLPHVDLVVSHGGAGTTLGAIEAGLPHLLLPYESQSQVGSAAAIDRLGAGTVLAPDARDPSSIAEAARRLLEEPSHRRAAVAVRASLDAVPGPESVVRRLAELVETRARGGRN